MGENEAVRPGWCLFVLVDAHRDVKTTREARRCTSCFLRRVKRGPARASESHATAGRRRGNISVQYIYISTAGTVKLKWETHPSGRALRVHLHRLLWTFSKNEVRSSERTTALSSSRAKNPIKEGRHGVLQSQ